MSDETKPQAAENFFALPPIAPAEESKPYWLGVLPGCPQYNLAAGGVAFQRYTDPPTGTDPDSMQTQRAWAKGGVEYLTDAQVATVRNSLKNKIVRFFGNRGQGMIMSLDNVRFTRQPGDQPLAMFVYMVAFDDKAVMARVQPKGEWPVSLFEAAGGQGRPVLPKKPAAPVADIAPEIEDLDKPAERQHVPPQMQGSKNQKR